ncbi:hypothetical protein ACYOEI_12750 [Singulisphaera rosea]
MPKFRIRTLMIAVVVLALAFGGLVTLQRMATRMQRYRVLAREHQRLEVVNRLTSQGLVMNGATKPGVERHNVLAEYHHVLNLKYEFAFRHPWLPVPPDPPEPR